MLIRDYVKMKTAATEGSAMWNSLRTDSREGLTAT
jgi:hypothetical protein